MSESIEMYLVMTALVRRAPDQPVAVSLLASKLGVTQVSANEMCHKLSERGLLAYQPYKGVTLTAEGEARARDVLSRRRLWVIFLVENLGIAPEEADALACQLEHITSERLVSALKSFLERSPALGVGPQAPESAGAPRGQPVSGCPAGTRGAVSTVELDPATAAFLHGQGLRPGAEAEVLVVGADGAALLGLGERRLALAPAVAARLLIAAPADHAARHEAWVRCSSFWACLRGDPCACSPPETERHGAPEAQGRP